MEKLTRVKDGYSYCGKVYPSFREALVVMLNAVTFKQELYGFKNIDIRALSPEDAKVYFALEAVHFSNIDALLISQDYNQYKKITRETIENGSIMFKYNPFYVKKLNIPFTYKSNHVMQRALCKDLDVVYDKKYSGVFRIGKKNYDYKVVISWLLDSILFNPKTTPFVEGIKVMLALDTNKRTAGLSDYLHCEDMPRARILAMQAECGDLDGDDSPILLNNLRRCDYPCKTLTLWGNEDYASVMLNLPESMMSSDYITWLDNAGKAERKDLGLVRKEKSSISYDKQALEHIQSDVQGVSEFKESEYIPEHIEDKIDGKVIDRVSQQHDIPPEGKKTGAPQVVSRSDEMFDKMMGAYSDSKGKSAIRIAAEKYCTTMGFTFEVVQTELKKKYTSERDVYYALKRYFGIVNIHALCEYIDALYQEYGSTGLDFETK